MADNAELQLQLRRDFTDFLDADLGSNANHKKIEVALEAAYNADTDLVKDVRVPIDVQDLQDHNSALHRQLVTDPATCLPVFEGALKDFIEADSDLRKQLRTDQKVHIALTGEFGPNHVSPRQLLSHFINQTVEVYGIVTKVSLVRPKMLKSVHYAEETGKFTTREYRDVTSFSGMPTGSAIPTRDEESNTLTMVYGCCEFVNHQQIVIQELPETAPAGQLPRSTEIVLEHDLVNTCKPGDRIAVVGVYRANAGKVSGTINGTFRAIVIANNVQQLRKEVAGPELTSTDTENIWKLAKSSDWLEHLAQSLAPSIYGYDLIKKALVLLLLGGREHNLENGTHLRGDINCLLIGDPGVAKSQLLRAIMNIAPLAVSTTGRGSSGVGLTAAITTSSDTGERQLEAGAMVLADRGIVCIDEFDKMGDNDRVAVHEVMEQQTVTIAKAGIHTSLHARCSVLAAANPLYGTYDHSLSVTKNINLPDSLLSRFDLLFVVLDHMDPHRDQAIAEHVVQQHLYRPPGDDGRTAIAESTDYRHELDQAAHRADSRDGEDNGVYVKYNAQLYGPRKPGQPDPLSVPFMKKFFHYAKARFSTIQLTQEATEMIADYYTELRANSGDRALPVTVRCLETIIRLASAHAKCRLSRKVEAADVEVAREILDAVMASSNGQVQPGNGWERRPKKGAKRGVRDFSDDEDDGLTEEERQRAKEIALADEMDTAAEADAMEVDADQENQAPPAADAATDEDVANLPGVRKSQLQLVSDAVRASFREPSEMLGRPLDDIVNRLQAKGVSLEADTLNKILTFLDLESVEGRFDVPFTFDTSSNMLYDMS